VSKKRKMWNLRRVTELSDAPDEATGDESASRSITTAQNFSVSEYFKSIPDKLIGSRIALVVREGCCHFFP
jgi:hypothetical protein